VTRAVATLVLAAIIAHTGCNPPAVRTVSLGGRPWSVYVGTGDGMHGLPGFGDVDGMLFDLGREVDPGGTAFTMEGIRYPIDIAWFDANGALVGMASMAPCDVPPCPLYHAEGPFRWALEAPAGGLADVGPTDRLVVED
jgi:uncharacterized membrane protein (UPF0127 family)